MVVPKKSSGTNMTHTVHQPYPLKRERERHKVEVVHIKREGSNYVDARGQMMKISSAIR